MDVFTAIPAKNEADIIGAVVRKLVEQGVRVVIVDDHSTDETAEIAEFHGATVEKMPEWTGIGGFCQQWLERVVRERPRWGLWMSADEIIRHRSGKPLLEALLEVEKKGFNCINLWRRDYVPVEGEEFFAHGDPEEHFRYYHTKHNEPSRYPRIFRGDVADSYRCTDVHTLIFEGKRTLDDASFILKHYPLRSGPHADRKIRQRQTVFEPWAIVQYRKPLTKARKEDLKHDI
jgi:glycosyltransferase involved in cell wall biosynthesis